MGPGRALFSCWGLESCLSHCVSWREACAKRVQPVPGRAGRLRADPAVLSPEDDRGRKIRKGLRRAVQRGRVLGGLRPARKRENQRIHLEALRQALFFSDVLDVGREKTLAALSRDLFAAGCATSEGKPLTPQMVKRLRTRLEEAVLAMARGELQDNAADWHALPGIRKAIQQRNRLMLVWLLKMARKDKGATFADGVLRSLLGSEHAAWVRDALRQA